MAKNDKTAEAEQTTEPAAAPASDDSRFIMLNVPEGHAVTQLSEGALTAGPQKRNDVIRALARTGEWTRGEIAKTITELQYTEEQRKAGKKVPYQIVFQATKGITNVKASPRNTGGEAAAPAEAGEAGEATPA